MAEKINLFIGIGGILFGLSIFNKKSAGNPDFKIVGIKYQTFKTVAYIAIALRLVLFFLK